MQSSDSIIQGRFRIMKTLGERASGVVYVAEDIENRNTCWVVKALNTAGLSTEEAEESLSKFESEKGILKTLNHPSIPKLISSSSEGGSHNFVMEYIQGETLDEIMQKNDRPFSAQEVIPIALKLAKMLEYLHNKKPCPIILGDLKPSNIILTERGGIRLIDLAAAQFYKPLTTGGEQSSEKPGSPVQSEISQSNLQTDIFSFGTTLYYLLTGKVVAQHNCDIPPLRKLAPNVPEWFEKLVMRCIPGNPGDSYPSTKDIVKAIEPRTFEFRCRTSIKTAMWAWIILSVILIISKRSELCLENPRLEYCSNLLIYLAPSISLLLLIWTSIGRWNTVRTLAVMLITPVSVIMLIVMCISIFWTGWLVFSGDKYFKYYPYQEVVKKVPFNNTNLVAVRTHGGAMDSFHILLYREKHVFPGLKKVRFIRSIGESYNASIEIIDSTHVCCYYDKNVYSHSPFNKSDAAKITIDINPEF